MSIDQSDPIATAKRLVKVYGHRLDSPVVYTQGVALSARLRLAGLTGDSSVVADIEKIVAPRMADGETMFDGGEGTANFAGICWADELHQVTGKRAYLDLLTEVADGFGSPTAERPIAPPLDPDIRVEDFFFAGTVLGRAFSATASEKYLEVLVKFLLAADTQQDDGLWWHCNSSPFYWGRGNAFAAMGFAEALTYLPPDHSAREWLLDSHLRHLEAMRRFQDRSGMWRQVVDRADSYLEHSATSMTGYALARGLRMGWLDAEWRAVADAAWAGVSERIGPDCELEHVCVGTGPQPDLESYLQRPFSDGRDDRGGSMALWFAVEMARLAEDR